jgi:stalled ribosome alternative rescue factor ArfA
MKKKKGKGKYSSINKRKANPTYFYGQSNNLSTPLTSMK